MESLEVNPRELPMQDSVDFPPLPSTLETLPSPHVVRARSLRADESADQEFRPKPVLFPEHQLIVKWGSDITVAEGQCLWYLGRRLPDAVPVPKIYGWRRDKDQTFLYMELIEGVTLAERWESLSATERTAICTSLSGMISAWRRLTLEQTVSILPPSPSVMTFSSFILEKLRKYRAWLWQSQESPPSSPQSVSLCQIGGQELRDIMFQDAGQYPAGPFDSVASFHKSFAGLVDRRYSGERDRRETIEGLRGLRDDVPVVFTHADLDLSNIIVSPPEGEPARILAIIDWHQSGWYPEPWEWLKARMVAVPGSKWVENYLNTVLKPAEYNYFYAFEYISMSTI